MFICGLSVSTIDERNFEKKLLYVKCVCDFLQLLSETFFILKRTGKDITINVKSSSCTAPIILIRF
jgi:hypothetical protein